ncbi:MAG TPA: ABC transporter permease, partial [Longimicrobiales bacterium]|nr:ABC transporter permease [Longimicrobiales bacterium]
MSIEVLRQAIASALRSARRQPGFTAAVVLTLALGIGANATMFSILDRLLLSPPEHVVDAERVRQVWIERPNPFTGEVGPQRALTGSDVVDLRAHGALAVAAYADRGEETVGDGTGAGRASVVHASAELFPLLGVQPRLGRFYTPDEAAMGAPPSAVISEEYWERAYGRDPGVIGRTIEVDGHEMPIVGVAPAGFTGAELRRVDVWLPLGAMATLEGNEACLRGRRCFWLALVARVEDGISIERAEEEATRLHRSALADEIEAGRYPDQARVLLPLLGATLPQQASQPAVARWLGALSLLVLLIACANVANLLLARGMRQRREMAVRLALGVSRRRMIAEAVLETLVLALGGGVLALALTRWGGGFVRAIVLPEVYFPEALDARLVAYTLLASGMAGLVAGIGPAIRASRPDLSEDLVEASPRASARRSRARALLIAAQAAMCAVLLVGAGLFVSSVRNVWSADRGIDLDRVISAEIELATADTVRRLELYQLAHERIARLPGVESVTGTGTPFGTGFVQALTVPGLDSLPRLPGGGPYVLVVDSAYFRTTGLRITLGRPFDGRDVEGAGPVALVSETMARALWPDQDPVGRCLLVGRGASGCTQVVGVVEDAARFGLREEPSMAYYLPATQAVLSSSSLRMPSTLYVRPRGAPDGLEDAIARELRAISPDVRWANVRTLRELVDPQARSWTLGA